MHGRRQVDELSDFFSMRRLVILVDYPMSPAWINFLKLDEISINYDVEFVEIQITGNQQEAFRLRSNIVSGNFRVSRIRNRRDLVFLARRTRNSIIIDITVAQLPVYVVLYRWLRWASGCQIARLYFNTVPIPVHDKNIVGRLLDCITKKELLSKSTKYTISRFKLAIWDYVAYDFSFVGGLSPVKFLGRRCGKIIESAGFDYIQFTDIKCPITSIGKTAVFIEENMAFDTDFVLSGGNPSADPKIYFHSLSTFLKIIEEKFHIKVQILPHPKSSRTRLSQLLGDFEILSVPSAEAIVASEFVLTHSSAAISFAVLSGKPIILISCDGMIGVVEFYMQAISRELNIPILSQSGLNLADNLELREFTPSAECAQSYIDNHVAHPRSGVFSFAEVIETISSNSEDTIWNQQHCHDNNNFFKK